MRRLLRLAMSQHVFHEPRAGAVAHTAASRLLAEDALLHQWMAWKTDEGWAASQHACAAMAAWPGSGEPGQTGFALAHGGQAMWPYLSGQPARLRRFADVMRLFSQRPGLEPAHVVRGYPWGEVPAGGTVVDVGGSHGAVSCAIARDFPDLKFVVQVGSRHDYTLRPLSPPLSLSDISKRGRRDRGRKGLPPTLAKKLKSRPCRTMTSR